MADAAGERFANESESYVYPGLGSTIGPAVVFGLRAARHMVRAAQPKS